MSVQAELTKRSQSYFTTDDQSVSKSDLNTKKTLWLLRWPRELTTKKTSPLSQPIVAIKNKPFFLLLPSSNLETDHKENTERGVYRVFSSGFTISVYDFLIPFILDDYNMNLLLQMSCRLCFICWL
jgi:hypothetical protein